ncbi:hypothetical protein Mycch_4428 [Mycolicibacterium chubuense NBB4]|uniref:Fibronectin type-III domain-containing protein n=1 Tax=Mycolicibacterium chubuense (strain NBB4) TaxID=710421 RepID=I4BPD0_MYCCN|nr:hypothetical protein [Mycolicibacterium chubuense]AFM19137.1 hypothetical protein Mycch_4428 [Mycolicibacterium chubuense NBB4]
MCATPARHRAARKDDLGPGPDFWAAKALVEGGRQGRAAKHARKVSAKYGLHIGRVGALAVSLGVGLAVANSAGVAYADSDSDSSVSPSSKPDHAASTAPHKPARKSTDKSDASSTDDPGSQGGDAGQDADEKPAPDSQDADPEPGTDEPADEDVPGEETASPLPGETDNHRRPSRKVSDHHWRRSSAPTHDEPSSTVEASTGASAGSDPTPDESPVAGSGEAGAATDEVKETGKHAPQPESVSVEVAATKSRTPKASAAIAETRTVKPVNIVSALVSSVVSPFVNPNAPAQAPWFDAMLAWVRRQINHTFFNKTPVPGQVTTSQILTGQVLVDVPAYDPNGDPLTFNIIQPKYGQVYRDPITGQFVYTPTSIVTGTPLNDSFQVVISDSSEHLKGRIGAVEAVFHTLARTIGIAQVDTVTVTIPITVNPIVELPPTVVTAGLPIFKLGGSPVKVVSTATITDLDSDLLSSATIRILTGGKSGDVLAYTGASGPIAASWDAATQTLTLTGAATAAEYEAAIKAVTFSTTEGGLPRSVTINVTDDGGHTSLVPGAALITVIGLPPLVTAGGLPIFKLGGSPVKVISAVQITDLDSTQFSSATLQLTSVKPGDVLAYTGGAGAISASWDAASQTLTLSGTASAAEYEAAIKAVTFSTTEGGLPRGLTLSVTDDSQVSSLVPAAALITVIGLPPLVTATGLPIFKLGGAPVKVISAVQITDVDSTQFSSATMQLTGGKTGDVLAYTGGAGAISASWDAASQTLTLSGTASAAQYEAAIKAVTFSTTEGGLPRGLALSVTDDSAVSSLVPAAALITVIGLPPLVTATGLPIFKLGGSPVKVISAVQITDLDSTQFSSATLQLTGAQASDVLSYSGTGVISASWDAASQTLTLSGTASAAEYEAAIKAVTFSTTEGGLPRGLTLSVTDDSAVSSLVPAAALITVIGLPPLVTATGLPIFKLGGSPVKVISAVQITDLDSTQFSSATLQLTGAQASDVLSYSGTGVISASWDAASQTLTLSGTASAAEYEAALKAVTFSTTEGGLPRGLTLSVTDDSAVSSLVPAAALITVIGLPPLVTATGLPIFKLGGSPVKVISAVQITDVDSTQFFSATLQLTGGQASDVLSYSGTGVITASWDAASQTLTLTGDASAAEYEAAIKAVTFSTTEGGLPRGLALSVADDSAVSSLVPAAALITVIGLPPLVTATGLPIFKLGGAPVKVISAVQITDVDSTQFSSATLQLTGAKSGDVLAYTGGPGSITASWDAASQTLTLSGTASAAEYEAAIKAVTFSTTEGGVARGLTLSVTDDSAVSSLVPAAALITVIGLPPLVTATGLPIFKLGGSPVKVISSVAISDLDSTTFSGATLQLTGAQASDVLSYSGTGVISVSWDAASQTLTLTGDASAAEYEAAIKAVTFSTTEGGVARGLTLSVTDDSAVSSLVPAAALITVIGLPPLVTATGLPIFKLGGAPVKVISSVVISDLDSTTFSSATLQLTGGKTGDVLAYTGGPGAITASWDAASQTLTLSGAASAAEYEAALKAVTFSTTEGGVARGLALSVTDDSAVSSLVPAAALITVIGLPPLVTATGLPIFKLGGAPVKVISAVQITDVDSTQFFSATLQLTGGQASDVLSYSGTGVITASWDAASQTLTLTGDASAAEYEAAIKAVTFSTTEGGLPRGLTLSVTDDSAVSSLVPAAALITVIGLPPLVTATGLPIFKLGGAPVKVISAVQITDVDSAQFSSATLQLTGAKSGDVLAYTGGPGSITASWDAASQTLTLSGTASAAEYEAAIKAVTFSTTEGGVARGLALSVTDDSQVSSLVPAAALITVIGLPPLVTATGLPIFKLGGAPVKVISAVQITDVDSTQFSSATLQLTGAKSGDVLAYTGGPGAITASWDAASQTLTLSGTASAAEYEDAIKTVTFSTTEGGVARGLALSVTDDSAVSSLVPAAALITVIGLPPLVTATGLPIFKLGGAPVKVISSVAISDLDSTTFSGATLQLTGSQASDLLSYSGTGVIRASWDAASQTLTLTGDASAAEYEAAIKAVTFSTTEGGVARGLTLSVTDDSAVSSLVPAAALITVIGLPPLVTATGLPIFKLGGSPVKVISAVQITDVDSAQFSSATLQLTGAKSGDVLAYTGGPGSITASWDAASQTLTLSGTASAAEYEAAIKAVTFSTTEGGVARGLALSVTDDSAVSSLVPAAALITVIGLPPLVTATGLPIFKLGGSPVKVISSVAITDPDSTTFSGATLQLTGAQASDVLSYSGTGVITAAWDAASQTLTLTGDASAAEYEAAIKAVTFTTTEGGVARGLTLSVTDVSAVSSLVPAAALITVIGLPPLVTATGLPIFKLGGAPVEVISSVAISDLDSTQFFSATMQLTGAKSGDVLAYTGGAGSITASWDAASQTLTLSGTASAAEYEAAIKAVTFSTTEGGVARGLALSVTDDSAASSLVPAAALITVIGLPPLVTAGGLPIFKLGGSPVKVLSSVAITDPDSTTFSNATLQLTGGKTGDVLAYTGGPGAITASWDAASQTLTLSGAASAAEYEAAIKAVTFSTTEGGVARGLALSVTDDSQVSSLVPAAALITVIGLPPLVTATGLPIFKLGGSPVKVLSSVAITDPDSTTFSSATLQLTGGKTGDVLAYTGGPGAITASWDAASQRLTLIGDASAAEYETAIKAVTFSTTEGGVARGLALSVTDDSQVSSLVPAAALITVIGLPPLVTATGLPIFKLGGAPVRVFSVATITDLDSDTLSGATITLTGGKPSDKLGFNDAGTIHGQWDAQTQTLTLTGAATKAEYEAALKAVTFTTTEGGATRSVTVAVTDDVNVASAVSVPVLISVIGLPPLVTATGLPVFKLGGAPVRVFSVATVTDLDSDTLSGATVTLAGGKPSDALGFNDTGTIHGEWDSTTQTLTLTGIATKAEYEAALKAVTFSTTEGGSARSVSVSVTDDVNVASAASVPVVISVIGLPPLVTATGLPIFKLGGAPVRVFSVATITDLDSDTLSGATVTLAGGKPSDTLAYSDTNTIHGTWDAQTQTLTLTGAATKAEYEAALQAVTFTTTEGGATRSVTVAVTDDVNVASAASVPVLISVIGLPPLVTATGLPVFKLGGAPVRVFSVATVTGLDSDTLSGATVTLTGGKPSDALGFSDTGTIRSTWDAQTQTLTLTGAATKAEYEAALQAVTFSTTEGGATRSVSVVVIDDVNVASAASVPVLISVIGLAPVVTATGLPVFKLGGAPVQVFSVATVTDLDSDTLSGATVTLAGGKSSDVLGYVSALGDSIHGTWDAQTQTLTLTGSATKAEYEAALKAVTFSTTEGGATRSVSVVVIDDVNVASAASVPVLISVIGLPPLVTATGLPIFKLGGAPVQVFSVATVTDLDSDTLSGATVTLAGGKSSDVLGYVSALGDPIQGSWDAETQTLTLTGAATKAEYEAALQAVTFSTTEGGATRSVSVMVIDDVNVASAASVPVLISVIGLPPVVTATGLPIFKLGGAPVRVFSVVTVSDLDSGTLSGATVTLAGGKSSDVLGFSDTGTIHGEWDAQTQTLTLTGSATKAEYEVALKAVTFTTTDGGGTRSVSVSVTDDVNVASAASVPVVISVIGLAPVVTATGLPVFKLGGAPVRVFSVATITDLDSDTLSSATVTLAGGKPSDTLAYSDTGTIHGTWDAQTQTLTLTGSATKAEYEAALQTVTFSTTDGGATRSVSVSVTDDVNVASAASVPVLISVIGLPPVVTATGLPVFKLGGAPVRVFSVVTVSDLDSNTLSGATVTLAGGKSSDVLDYVSALGDPIQGSWDAQTQTLTLTGSATKAEYEAALQAVTFTTTDGGATRSVSVAVTDDVNVASAASVPVLISVIGLPPVVTATGLPIFKLGGAPVRVFSVATITDLDSDTLSGATVTLAGGKSSDVLNYVSALGDPIHGSWDADTQTLTLTGSATKTEYEAALQAVTFSTTEGGATRRVTVVVTDDVNVASAASVPVLVSVIGLAPVVTATGVPVFKLGGAPVRVFSVATVTDLDSDTLSGATVTLAGGKPSDALGFSDTGTIRSTWDAQTQTLTLTGSATKAEYEAALKAVTFSTTEGGATRSVSVVVIDDVNVASAASVPVLISVIGLPPLVTATGLPIFKLGGAPVQVFSVATVTDLDSDTLSSATVTLTGGKSSDVLGFSDTGTIHGEWDAQTQTLTLTGSATKAEYEVALKAVTFTTTDGGGTRSVSVSVTDDVIVASAASVPVVISVIGLAPVVTATGLPVFKLGGAPVRVFSVATITDLDSDTLSGATVTLAAGKSSDVLGYVSALGDPIQGSWDAQTQTLTLTGSATKADYEAALQTVTFSTTEGGATRSVTVAVTDDVNVASAVSVPVLVSVIGLPPLVNATGLPIFKLGGAPVRVFSVATITDLDSDTLSGATVTLAGGKSSDVLGYVSALGDPIQGSWDAQTQTLTLTGSASKAEYEAALQAVTFTTTEGGATRSVTVTVTDDVNVASAASVPVLISVIGLPPVVTATGLPVFKLGGAPVRVFSAATITDLDSDTLSGATVTLAGGMSSDVLNYASALGDPIQGSWDAQTQTLTLTGSATKAEYEAALKAVTFSTTEGGAVRSVTVAVTDDVNVASAASVPVLVSVIGLAPVVTATGLPVFKLGGAPVRVFSVATVTDLDSDTLSGATVTLAGGKSSDVLGYVSALGDPIQGSWEAETQTLTLTGSATKAEYEAALQAITFRTTEGGATRSVTVVVTDDVNVASAASVPVLISVIGLPPVVTATGLPIFKLGGAPVRVFSVATITDLDSDTLSGATVTLAGGKSSDVLGFSDTGTIHGEWDAQTQTLTLTGSATKAEYEVALKAVTFTTTDGGGTRSVSVSVTDDVIVASAASVPVVISVIGLPPVVTATGLPVFKLGGAPVRVFSVATITDLDSNTLSGATVTLAGGKSSDVLDYVSALGDPIQGSWDAQTQTLTLTGSATKAEYEAALQAVTFSTTEGGATRSVTVVVTDDVNVASAASVPVVISVIGLAPLVTATGLPIFKLGGAPVRVFSVATVTDLDSDTLSGATITLAGGKPSDTLAYSDTGIIHGAWDSTTQTLTLTGSATKAEYEAALKAVTFSTTEGGSARSVSVVVTDDVSVASAASVPVVVTVIGLPPSIVTVGAPVFKLGGSPVKIVTSATISDVDSDQLSKAALTITGSQAGDVLSYVAPSGVSIQSLWDAATSTLTLSGLASKADYESAIEAVTFSTTDGGPVRGVTIVVTDDSTVDSLLSSGTLITVVGLPPSVTTVGAPIFKLGSSPVTVVSVATIIDADSTQMSQAVVKIASGGKDGDILSYTAPEGVSIQGSWDAVSQTLTLSGIATTAEYEAAIKAVTFSTTAGGAARSISVSVTDDVGVTSAVPGSALVTVVGLPPSLTVLGAPVHTIGAPPVKVASAVSISDADSQYLSKATVAISLLGQTGDVLGYAGPAAGPISASWDADSLTLTLSGQATLAEYETALANVTFAATQSVLIARTISFSVTDDTQVSALLPATVTAGARYSLAPTITTTGGATYTFGKAPVTFISAAGIADADSDYMSQATVKITAFGQSGDALAYATISGIPITASWDAASSTLTLSGVATKAQYEQALEAVTFSASGGAGIIRTVSVSVSDDTGVSSVLPGTVTVSAANPLAPLVTTTGRLLSYGVGDPAVNPVATASVLDGDSDYMTEATLRISNNFVNGDVLAYVAIAGNPIQSSWDSATRTLRLYGTATKAQYEQALQAVTFSATTFGGGVLDLIWIRSIAIVVKDDSGQTASAGVTLSVTR